MQPYARLGAQPFHLLGVVGVHAGDGHAPVGGQRERRGPYPAFAAAEDEDAAAVAGDLAGDADGGLGADGGATRPVGLVDRGQEGQLPGEPGGPPDGADEPGTEPVRDLVRVGDRRGQADDAGGRAVVPYAGEQRLQDRAARRVAEQMDLVDDQAADLGERVPQRAGAADRLELLGGGDPDVGRPDQLRVHRRLTGQAHHPQSPVTPQPQFAVEFVGERALRHQPGGLAAAGVRLQGGDHPDRGLSRARRRHDDEVPGALQHRRDGGGLHRVERRVRQHGGPGVGHEAADGHVRLDGALRQLLQRVPLGGEGVPGRGRPATGGRGGAVRTGRDQFGAVAGVPDRADLPGLLPVPADPVRNTPLLQPRPQGPVAAPSGRITRTSSAAASAASAGRHAGSAVAHHSSARGSVASGASRSPGHTGPVTMRTRRGGCPGTRTTAVTATSGRSERLTAGADAGPGRGERTAWPGTFPASWSYRFTPRSARVNAAGQEGQTSAVYW
ncbi:hypothetical protein SCALM49S_07607 [Streptomyces californicus]